MSLALYTTPNHDYFYALEMGGVLEIVPETTVYFGEGPSPAEAVWDLQPTQYQAADFRCRFPANQHLCRYFSVESDLVDPTEDEENEAKEQWKQYIFRSCAPR